MSTCALQSNAVSCDVLIAIRSGTYRLTEHQSMQTAFIKDNEMAFEQRWTEALSLANHTMPSILSQTTEIRALMTMLDNKFVIKMVKEHIQKSKSIQEGLCSFLETSVAATNLPLTARCELFSFIQMLICPHSYFYPDTDILLCRNISLMEFLMIGHCQLEGFIFDGAVASSHAVVAAKSIGKSVLLTRADLPVMRHKAQIYIKNVNAVRASVLSS